ncbi:hypothetical protein AALP_AAs65865U000100 [Arabis alpina]|uniref:SLC26A/SulP transporter domain-containing protein n=1 Tax=Arabis alpina TaxID=50452 RepID=A0A087G1N5_ARAAL|nr:hypothetical protein AALP_AAs65865U000100 [Arabis alpina]
MNRHHHWLCSTVLDPGVQILTPQCASAGIVISAVIGLVDYEGAIFLWCVDKRDFTLWTITSGTTLFFGIEIGVLIVVTVFLDLDGWFFALPEVQLQKV